MRSVEDGHRLPKSRASRARLLKMVFEVAPLTSGRCGAEMKVISVITTPALIDRLLNHARAGVGECLPAPVEGPITILKSGVFRYA